MRKNNKGFTLIEIIAVITILGILAVVTMPKLLDLVTKSRDEMYVQDAKKLIAQAQYVMSSKSDEIEKPMSGDYIVLSLNYLGGAGFDSPPNGGKYLTEASFVVVKSIQKENSTTEKYKYSAVLVEKAKDGYYRGIKMSTEEELASASAKTLVSDFEESDLVYVDKDAADRAECLDEESCVVGKNYINNNATDEGIKPADDSSTIIGRYNYVMTNSASGDREVFSAPTFSVKALSESATIQSLRGSLVVSAKDPDTSLNELKVCVKVSKNASDTYPEMTDTSLCKPYTIKDSPSEGEPYTYNFDLSTYNFSYYDRDNAYFYIVVFDPQNNYSRKKITYEIHKNLAPEILSFVVSRHRDNSTDFNLNYVNISADVKDDMEDNSKLSVCLLDKASAGASTCSNYVPFDTYFSEGSFKYVLRDNNGKEITKPDGSIHYLTLFVKDSHGAVSYVAAKLDSSVSSSENGPYVIYKNLGPTLKVNLVPNKISPGGAYQTGNSLQNVKVSIDVNDDMTSTDKIKVKIGEYKEATMAEFNAASSPLQHYNFDGDYDGKDRKLKVIATDEYGASTTVTATLTNVYKNDKPNLVFNINSSDAYVSTRFRFDNENNKILISPRPAGCSNGDESACFVKDSYVCHDTTKCKSSVSNGNVTNGSYIANITSTISDDLTPLSNMKACLTLESDGCTKDSEFEPASKFISYPYVFETPEVSQYNDKTVKKTLRLVVKDEQGLKTEKSLTYSFYKNSGPKFENVVDDNITSTRETLNVSSVVLKNSFTINDDFEDYDVDFCYLVKDRYYSGVPTSSDFNMKKCTRVNPGKSMNFVFKDGNGVPLKYSGQKIYTMYKATDGYGKVGYSKIGLYTLSSNVPPEIIEFKAQSTTEKYNSIRFNASFKVSDPEDTYSVCLTTLNNESYCDASTYEGRSHFNLNIDGKAFDGNNPDFVNTVLFNGSSLKWSKDSMEKWKYSFDVASVFKKVSESGQEEEADATLVFVVMDSSGDTDSYEFKYIPRYSCGIYDEEMEKIKNNEISEDKEEVYIDIKEESDYEVMTAKEATDAGLSPGGDNMITPSACSGRCYTNVYPEDLNYVSSEIPEKNNWVAFYRKKISFTDKLVEEEIKNFGLPQSDVCKIEKYPSLGCNYASCFDIDGGTNNNVISLHLYDKDITWTTKIKGVGTSKTRYNSYCKIPAKQNELLFCRTDYRVRQGKAVSCNSSIIETSCKNSISKNFDEQMPTELLRCEIERIEPSEECVNVRSIDCNELENHREFVNEDLFNRYHDNDPEVTKEAYDAMIAEAIASCRNNIADRIKACDEADEANDKKYNEELAACEERIAPENEKINENNKKREEYNNNLNACITGKGNLCDTLWDSYSIIDPSDGKVEVSCDRYGSDSSIKKVLCDSSILGGKCKESNCDEGSTCKEFCYKDINCKESIKMDMVAKCRGYFKLYRSTVSGKKVLLQDTGMRICPELVSSRAYGNLFTYKEENPEEDETEEEKPKNKQTYIKFFPKDYGGIINE